MPTRASLAAASHRRKGDLMFMIHMPLSFKVGDTAECRINMKPRRLTWRDNKHLVIEADDAHAHPARQIGNVIVRQGHLSLEPDRGGRLRQCPREPGRRAPQVRVVKRRARWIRRAPSPLAAPS